MTQLAPTPTSTTAPPAIATSNAAKDMEAKTWWSRTADETVNELSTDPINGLTEAEAASRLAKYGPNELPSEPEESVFAALINAFRDPLALVLTGAAVVSAVIGLVQNETEELQQAGWIMGIVI
ncbi:MAG: hypothetical protein KF726_08885, partial [Anaerolineae bacterium]|nr:hypothetical protein [Anaerolineae bacterium]